MITNYLKYYFLAFVFTFSISVVKAEIPVAEYLDQESGSWAHKISDYAYVFERNDCKIKWNAIKNKTGDSYLRVRRNCPYKFIDQIKLHRAILNKIDSKTPIHSYKYITWGMFCDESNLDWCKPIAELSLQSEDYIDYWKNYPNSRINNPNSIFVKLANSSQSYSSFNKLLLEFGVKVKLESVEKVFSSKLNSSPFSSEFGDKHSTNNPRIMYNVGMAVFEIIQLVTNRDTHQLIDTLADPR